MSLILSRPVPPPVEPRVLGVPFVSEQVALSAVEPAVAYLTAPLLSLRGPEVATATSEALVSLLLPLTTRTQASSSAVIFTDAIGQVCIRLQPLGQPFVVWPLAVGLFTPENAPRPYIRQGTTADISSSYAIQASRTRLLVRSLVLQSAMDLMALAKTDRSSQESSSSSALSPSKRRKPLTIAVPSADVDMTLVEIIRTAVPIDVSSGADLSSPFAAFPPHLAAAAAAARDPGSRFSMTSSVSEDSSTSATPTNFTLSTASTPSLTTSSSSSSTSSTDEEWDIGSTGLPESSGVMVLEPILFSPLYLGDFASFGAPAEGSPTKQKEEVQHHGRSSWWSLGSIRGMSQGC
jgi:hypothetical protein